jgi:hypothetical protein
MGAAAAEDDSPDVTVTDIGGGIRLRAQRGMLEVTFTSGKNTRNRSGNRASQVTVRRTWACGTSGSSMFVEVNAVDNVAVGFE